MKSPLKSTPHSFCELVIAEAAAKNLTTHAAAATALGMSTKTWYLILGKKLDLNDANTRRQHAWIRLITRICDALELDLDACLKACGLIKNAGVVNRVRQRANSSAKIKELSEADLVALLELAKKVKRPVPLDFACEYLALLSKSKE